MYYLFEEHFGGGQALFSTYYEAKAFADKYISYINACDGEADEHDYSITSMELNPNFDKWWSSTLY